MSNPDSYSANGIGLLVDIANDFWDFRRHFEPLASIQAGEATRDDIVFRESPDAYNERQARAKVLKVRLDTVDVDGLGAEEKLTHELLRRDLDDILRFHELRAHERPQLFPLGPEYYAVEFAHDTSIATREGAERYVERLRTLPSYFSDVISNLRNGSAAKIRFPRNILLAAASVGKSYCAVEAEKTAWYEPFVRSRLSPAALEPAAISARQTIQNELVPALFRYAEFLEGPLLAESRESVACTEAPNGEAFYQALIEHFTNTTLSARELHELGHSEVARITELMAPIASDAGFGKDVRAYRGLISSDPQFLAPSKDALRERLEAISKRIDLCIPSLFGRTPRATYGIRSIPEATSPFQPPAYAQIGPADRTAPGIHWVTSLPAKAPASILIPLALHEAWPGHLMHMALLQELTELPAFRRFGTNGAGSWRYSAYLEGWAMYCEGLGEDMGLYQAPHEQFGRLDMEMWRALRLVVDTGLHAFGWSLPDATSYMSEHLAMSRATIEAEVDRYVAQPGQGLSYQVGNLRFRAARQRAETQLDDRFDIRAYHDRILAAGPLTLAGLDLVVDTHISAAKSRKVPAS